MPMLPFTLNIVCDGLVKNEFDYYRKKQELHPIFIKHGIKAVPFDHPEMDNWRPTLKELILLMRRMDSRQAVLLMIFGLKMMAV